MVKNITGSIAFILYLLAVSASGDDTDSDCTLYCENAGDCHFGATYQEDDMYCDCPSGYEGKLCEVIIGESVCTMTCENNGLCQLGTSQDDGMYCVCPDGYVGTRCEVAIGDQDILIGDQDCTLNCENNGECHFGATGQVNVTYQEGDMHCVCPSGYQGRLCDEPLPTEDDLLPPPPPSPSPTPSGKGRKKGKTSKKMKSKSGSMMMSKKKR
jgi:hypothetical protein